MKVLMSCLIFSFILLVQNAFSDGFEMKNEDSFGFKKCSKIFGELARNRNNKLEIKAIRKEKDPEKRQKMIEDSIESGNLDAIALFDDVDVPPFTPNSSFRQSGKVLKAIDLERSTRLGVIRGIDKYSSRLEDGPEKEKMESILDGFVNRSDDTGMYDTKVSLAIVDASKGTAGLKRLEILERNRDDPSVKAAVARNAGENIRDSEKYGRYQLQPRALRILSDIISNDSDVPEVAYGAIQGVNKMRFDRKWSQEIGDDVDSSVINIEQGMITRLFDRVRLMRRGTKAEKAYNQALNESKKALLNLIDNDMPSMDSRRMLQFFRDDPDFQGARSQLQIAKAYERIGDLAQSRTMYQNIINSNFDDYDRSAARRALNRINDQLNNQSNLIESF